MGMPTSNRVLAASRGCKSAIILATREYRIAARQLVPLLAGFGTATSSVPPKSERPLRLRQQTLNLQSLADVAYPKSATACQCAEKRSVQS